MKLFLIMAITAAIATAANAAAITGQLWAVDNSVASDATPANVPTTAPDVTFQVDSPLNFTNPGSVTDFLVSGGAFNINGTAAELSSPISPSLIEFMGTVTVTTANNSQSPTTTG